MPKFSKRSQERLSTCHPDLQRLFNEVIKHYDCTVLDGHRSEKLQDFAFYSGKSKVKWPNSKHNSTPALAVDIVPYPVDWENINEFYQFAGFVKATAIKLNINVKWGGNFEGFFDGPHWELDL